MRDEHNDQLTTADVAAYAARSRDERVGRSDESDTSRGESSASNERERTPLFPSDQADDFRSRWTAIQSGFVDEPRNAVEQADSLIAEVMNTLAKSFAAERQNLEQQWDRGNDVSTEELRLGLRKDRSFFDRLLSL